jgi:hypothetical protein
MRLRSFALSAVMMAISVGCNSSKPFIAIGPTQPASAAPVASPATEPVATSDLGKVTATGATPKPKPFIALPRVITQLPAGSPSTLLREHAVAESPVPLSEYGNQPIHTISDFNLRSNLSVTEVEKKLGEPAQLADNEDPWLVYRLSFNRELWLHFTGPLMDHLDAADVIRGAEDGYTRDRVFSADDVK